MESKYVCQSCTMPIDMDAKKGTEKNGSLSNNYCRYCYRDGDFTNPQITLEEMKTNIISQMQKQHIPDDVIFSSVTLLPSLKRWK